MYYRHDLQTDILALLQAQHRSYTAQLSNTHQSLGKLYKKLARVERSLVKEHETPLSRRDKKRLHWSKMVTKNAVDETEWQQKVLHGYLAQCDDLMRSYTISSWHIPTTPRTATQWMSTNLSSPLGLAAQPHWTSVPIPVHTRRPQYWDLSGLPARRESSSYAPSADSGFHEPSWSLHSLGVTGDGADDPDHVFSHELMSFQEHQADTAGSAIKAQRSQRFPPSEEDIVPEPTASPTFHTKRMAQQSTSSHRRRYSENITQSNETRLVAPELQRRGMSVAPVSRGM